MYNNLEHFFFSYFPRIIELKLSASLPPMELKKLRAQQRKAAKRAEQEKQEKLLQQQREQREREQREREQRDPHSHHQKRAHNQQDKEADAPPVDDLQPQKLARVCICFYFIASFSFILRLFQ